MYKVKIFGILHLKSLATINSIYINFSSCYWLCPCSITLILVVSDDAPSELHSTYLLEVVFAAMILLIGLHELEDVSNKVERLKKELKVCSTEILFLLYWCPLSFFSLLSPSLSPPLLPPPILPPKQCCYPLIDHILQGCEDGQMSLLTQCPDIFAVGNEAIIEVVNFIQELILCNYNSYVHECPSNRKPWRGLLKQPRVAMDV